MTNDMRAVIIPRSDQINADSLIAGPLTITITEVSIRPGTEQPISIQFDGDGGKPWKPCKSMARVMVHCWGADANEYTGRSLRLYCDPKVLWGGLAIGGIRISHMSHINGAQTMALTATKGSRKPFTVLPLEIEKPTKKAAPTIADWIAGTLAPALDRCASADELHKAQQSKGYVAALAKGTDADKEEIQRIVDRAAARIENSEYETGAANEPIEEEAA